MHKVLRGVDKNSNEEKHAVLSLFIDWKQAFSRLSHTLGVQSFIDNGVRASLIPILTSYFEERKMFVRWQGEHSGLKDMPGSGAMGATLGILEYTSQTNNIADCIPVEDRSRFIDDLTSIEVINLLTIGLSSLNVKTHIPSDLPIHGKFIDGKNLKSQGYLDEIDNLSEQKLMRISETKTKAMIFNFTQKKHNFLQD